MRIHVLFFSIEGARVRIVSNDKTACKVIIENAGPEDNGDWKLEGIFQKGHQLFRFTRDQKVNLDGIMI